MKKTLNQPATLSRLEGDLRPRRKPYCRPRVEEQGRLPGVVRFPGGSINTEGLSGKPHQQ